MACKTYEEFVALYLNVERVRADTVTDMVLAIRIASGDVQYPREWRRYGEES